MVNTLIMVNRKTDVLPNIIPKQMIFTANIKYVVFIIKLILSYLPVRLTKPKL